jgi:hypothetical protein
MKKVKKEKKEKKELKEVKEVKLLLVKEPILRKLKRIQKLKNNIPISLIYNQGQKAYIFV